MKNRLNKSRCYLFGAVDRVLDGGHGWRNHITSFLQPLGVEVFNPLKKPTTAGIESIETVKYKNLLKKEKRYEELSSIMKAIRNVDLRMVDVCDFLIANIDLDHYAVGTYEEIFLANRQKKPIVIHIEQGKQNAPDWLFGAIPHELIFSDWEELELYILHINGSNSFENYNRWIFFQ